jgi:hypothetical protein
MSGITGPNLVISGLIFNIDSFKYNSFDLGQKTWNTNDGRNNTGNITGALTFNTTTGAVAFDGSSLINYGILSTNLYNSNFTLETWVYPTSNGGYKSIMSIAADSSNWQVALHYFSSGTFRFETPGGTIQDAATYPVNNWYHVVCTVSSGNSTIWVNGVQTTAGTGNISNGTAYPLRIGNSPSLGSFVGNIRAVRIYNRALTDVEIVQNYRAFYTRTFETVSFSSLTTTQLVSSTTIYANQFSTVTPISYTGGYRNVTYSISPTLPTNTSMNVSTGVITGTPSALSSVTTYTITATDAIGQTSSKTLNLTVAALPLTTVLNIASNITLSQNTYNQYFPVIPSGGFGTYTYSISALPISCGANLNTTTGLLTLAPTAGLSSTSVTITVQDQSGQSSSNSFNLTVITIPADPQTITTSVPFSFTGAAQSFTVPAGIYWIRVTANGGGGSGGGGDTTPLTGGLGGQIVGWVATAPGTVYSVIVGGGGAAKGGTVTTRYGGGGGGFSGLISGSTHIVSAGGGGGSSVNIPAVGTGVATTSGGHTVVYSSTPASGGPGGTGNSSTIFSNSILNGASGDISGGGNGGTTWTGSASLDAGGAGGGGGYGTSFGLGGNGTAGNGINDGTGVGSRGGFGGGGGGGGGGTGGTIQRTNPGGGGGGGYIGGQGGQNNITNANASGQGGWNFLKDQTNPRGGATTPLVLSSQGGGSAGGSAGGVAGTNGSVTIQY